jgi:hypothetical protein
MNDMNPTPPPIPTPPLINPAFRQLGEDPAERVPITSIFTAIESILRQPRRVMFQLRQQGAKPETIREIHALGFGPYSTQELIQFTNQGVRADLFRGFKEAGWKNLTPSEIVDVAHAGLRGVDLRDARQYGQNLSLNQIIRLKQAGLL